jgi:two-component system, cell cycle response regulator DivK
MMEGHSWGEIGRAKDMFQEVLVSNSTTGFSHPEACCQSVEDAPEPVKQILIVEDSQDDREMYTYFLSANGFRVAAASDGEAALPKALEVRPDVIVMDLWMPGLDGWEATRRLKRNAQTKDIPILVLTGHPYWVEWENVQGLLRKPCGPYELLQRVQDILNRNS